MSQVLEDQCAESLEEAAEAFVAEDARDTVEEAFVLRRDGDHVRTGVRVVDDGASALHEQPVQDGFEREEHNVRCEIAPERGQHFRVVDVCY